LNFEELCNITEGEIVSLTGNPEITDLITDSRKTATISKNSVFFAINGVNHNGHDFLQELYDKGLRSFVVEKKKFTKLPTNTNICLVPSAINALQNIAAFHRKKFQIPVIGIVGSNGKTIIKEWLAQFLSGHFNVVKSPKSYNSQLGVPLSVWQLNAKHTLAIFEAGISTVNEMHFLKKIIDPTIGIFTNIGSAHEKGFENIAQKIQEKLKLISDCQTIIYCKDHHLIHKEISKNSDTIKRSFTWSFNEKSDITIKRLSFQEFKLNYRDQELHFTLPFYDEASIENLSHCIACLLFLKIDCESIQMILNQLEPVKMRLELKKGMNGCYIIDDTYNNDLAGLKIALQFLQSQNQRTKKTLILSDIPQSSLSTEALYKQVNHLVVNANLHQLICIGSEISSQAKNFEIQCRSFMSTSSFLKKINELELSHEMILVKGARTFQFEKIVASLAEKLHETILEIDLDALTNNLNFYRKRLNPTCKLMVMVKAFAYGSGSTEISNLLQFHKVDYLAVAYTDEAIELRNNGIQLPIMVMNPKNDLDQLLSYDLEPEVFDLNQLKKLNQDLLPRAKELSIHININTGMNRMGFEVDELKALTKLLLESKSVKVKSIFTHLAGADSEEHKEFSLTQLEVFENFSSEIESNLEYTIIKHALNSAGIINFPKYQMDMVRLGIGLHGFDPTNKFSGDLESVSTFKTIISQVRTVNKGDTIGYSRKGVAKKDCEIATIALGYADGFSRSFSNGVGKVLVNGSMAKVIGNVCMDMTMVDVTNLNAKAGDEVIIFGQNLSIEEVAKSINTIPYEILTSVSDRVKRVYYTS